MGVPIVIMCQFYNWYSIKVIGSKAEFQFCSIATPNRINLGLIIIQNLIFDYEKKNLFNDVSGCFSRNGKLCRRRH